MNAGADLQVNPVRPNAVPKELTPGTFGFERAECWYCHQLWIDTGVDVQQGETTYELRQARVRELLIGRNLADVPVLPRSAKRETHRQFFQRLYGVTLDGEVARADTPVQEALL